MNKDRYVKPYTWEEIKGFLLKELDKTKHIMTFGTIGSLNINHDIDVIITKKPNVSSASFYEEIHDLFNSLNEFLHKKNKAKLVRFNGHKEEFLMLANFNEGKDLAVETFVYTSFQQIKRDWNWSLFEGESVKDVLKNYNLLKGSLDDLYSEDFLKARYTDPIFLYLNIYDRINSNYRERFLLKVMNYYYDYLYRKKLGLKSPIAKNLKEVREYFYKLCDILDELDEKKSKAQ